MTYTLAEIAIKLDAKLVVPAELDDAKVASAEINGLATLANAASGQVAFYLIANTSNNLVQPRRAQ